MGNEKKKEQLGMAIGTAANRLRKAVLFDLLEKTGLNICFQCGEVITDIATLSIEHKVPWLDSDDPKGLFFDLDNIAFSHLSCNIGAARKPKSVCGTNSRYSAGCRCVECTAAAAKKQRDSYTPERRRRKYLRSGH